MNLIDTYWPFGLLAATAVGAKNGLFILIFFQFFKVFNFSYSLICKVLVTVSVIAF